MKQGRFNDIVFEYNNQLDKEIELNINNPVQSIGDDLSTKIFNINKQINFMLENEFVDSMYRFLIKEKEFLENILNYISEFIYYLVMF